MKKQFIASLLGIILTLLVISVPGNVYAQTALAKQSVQIKNVIFLIPDGMSMGGVTLARWFQGGKPLAMDELACGLIRTYNADTPIADSAPAGTTFATGYKTNTPYIAVLPSAAGMWGVPPAATPFRPIASVLEAARLSGKSTGLVTTCEIAHATPASFSAHASNRRNYDDILEQQVYNGLTVVFSGGYQFLEGKNRKDKEELVQELKNLGYTYITTKNEFESLKITGNSLVWGLFAPVDLAYEIDRDKNVEPSLAEMTKKAIDILSQNNKGFFLMVEGSKIDWAAHANDPVGLVSDILAFDEAVRVALQFAKSRNDTIIIIASDHGNSGITIGDRSTTNGYDKIPLATFIKPLQAAKKSGYMFASLLKEDKSNLLEVLASVYGITDATQEEIDLIKNTKLDAYTGMSLIGGLIAKRAKIGFTTGGHTGEDVVLYVYTPQGANKLTGTVQNTDIAWYIAEMLGVNLYGATQYLYAPAEELFKASGAKLETDLSTPDNPVLIVRAGNKEIRFPVNKNYCIVNGKNQKLDGVTVYIAETKSWYVNAKAIEFLK